MFTAYANIATAVEAMRAGRRFHPETLPPTRSGGVLSKIAKTHSLQSRAAVESQLAERISGH